MIAYSLRAARRSGQSVIPVKIVNVDYAMIGIHEQFRPGEVERLAKVMLDEGYNWPPIAVFQAGSDTLFQTAADDARLILDYGDIGVADGHHRLAAVARLGEQGLLRDPYIPVQLIPAHDPSKILNLASDPTLAQMTIDEIESRFPKPAKNFPPATTHFRAILTTGEWVPIRESQPDLIIQPAHLLQGVGSTR